MDAHGKITSPKIGQLTTSEGEGFSHGRLRWLGPEYGLRPEDHTLFALLVNVAIAISFLYPFLRCYVNCLDC